MLSEIKVVLRGLAKTPGFTAIFTTRPGPPTVNLRFRWLVKVTGASRVVNRIGTDRFRGEPSAGGLDDQLLDVSCVLLAADPARTLRALETLIGRDDVDASRREDGRQRLSADTKAESALPGAQKTRSTRSD